MGIDLYGELYWRVLFPTWEERLRRRPTLARLRYLRSTERRGADELAAIQLGQLRRLLRHAWLHVPFYRARMDAAGLHPDEVRAVDALRKLPLLTRADAQAGAAARRSTAPPLPSISKKTSGSTGQPLVFGYDPDSEYWRQAVKLRGYGWAGYRQGDRTLHYWGAPPVPAPPRARMKIMVDRLIKRERYLDSTPRSPAHLAAAVAAIRRDRPRSILCFTQGGVELARYIVANGARTWDTIPVLCGAEKLYPQDRGVMEAAFGPAVFETYGCREVMLIGMECEAHRGLHVASEHLVVEVIVRAPGQADRPARPGETGEVVITDLHNLGMPFIRYANGDLAVAADEAVACPCGRALPRLASVDGRVTDSLRDAGGNRVGGLIFNVIFAALADTVTQFQAVQHLDGSVTLKLVPTPALDAAAREHIRRNCEKYLPGIAVTTELVSEIPVGKNGKRQVVVVERA